MKGEFDFASWFEAKHHLIVKYPDLTQSDVDYRHGTKDDLLQAISRKLGKTKKELEQEIETALSDNFE
jgi:hypothetical protein